MLLEGTNEEELRTMPADSHALGSPQMVRRGEAVRSMYWKFTSRLAGQAVKYWRPEGPSATGSSNIPAPIKMGAVGRESTRLPPGADAYSLRQLNHQPRSKPEVVYGLEASNDNSNEWVC